MAEEQESAIKQTDEWGASVDVAIGDNPATLALLAETRYRHIYRQDSSPLWDGLYAQGGFQLNVTPAFGRIGAHIEWLPIAILQLRLQYDHYHFLGSMVLFLLMGQVMKHLVMMKLKRARAKKKLAQEIEYYFSPPCK